MALGAGEKGSFGPFAHHHKSPLLRIAKAARPSSVFTHTLSLHLYVGIFRRRAGTFLLRPSLEDNLEIRRLS